MTARRNREDAACRTRLQSERLDFDPKRSEWLTKIQPALKKPPLSVLVRECGARLSRREIIELRAGRSRPRRKTQGLLESILRKLGFIWKRSLGALKWGASLHMSSNPTLISSLESSNRLPQVSGTSDASKTRSGLMQSWQFLAPGESGRRIVPGSDDSDAGVVASTARASTQQKRRKSTAQDAAPCHICQL
jgi:hypothetical protein